MFNRHSLIRILCVVSLILLSFAHQPVGLNSTYTPTGADYALSVAQQQTDNPPFALRSITLPDGSVVVICASDGSDYPAGPHHSELMASCEACRISASIILPLPEKSRGPMLQRGQSSSTSWQAAELPITAIFPPAAPPQAPPVA